MLLVGTADTVGIEGTETAGWEWVDFGKLAANSHKHRISLRMGRFDCSSYSIETGTAGSSYNSNCMDTGRSEGSTDTGILDTETCLSCLSRSYCYR